MNIAERIRQAALGPTPEGWQRSLSVWTSTQKAWAEVHDHLPDGLFSWLSLSEEEKRFFLLFVAEALGQMDLKSI